MSAKPLHPGRMVEIRHAKWATLAPSVGAAILAGHDYPSVPRCTKSQISGLFIGMFLEFPKER
jgi:hypothetical protein